MELCRTEEQQVYQPASSVPAVRFSADFASIVRTTAPIILSASFKRLRRITFLGILSPSYSDVERHPFQLPVSVSDGNRAHHSFKVALLAGRISENLSFSTNTVRYAIIWGLLHDIATWPLSHTGEAAFADATSTQAGILRQMMIKGDSLLHRSLCVYMPLKEIGIDIDVLLALFDKQESLGTGEIAQLHQVLHSALTPDTLEGMHRSGNTFGLAVPPPEIFIDAMERDLISGVRLKKKYSKSAIMFWRAKRKIYSDFINEQQTVSFESSWSAAIRDRYTNISLTDSLFVEEAKIIRDVSSNLLSLSRDIVRYKAPLSYQVALRYRTAKSFKDSLPLNSLSQVFVKNRA